MRQAYRRGTVSFGNCFVILCEILVFYLDKSYYEDLAVICSKYSNLLITAAFCHFLYCTLIKIMTSLEKMSPSEIVVQDGKQANVRRQGDSCTVLLSIAKIVVSPT